MNTLEKSLLIEQERNHVWHPFTCMQEWNDPLHEPLVLVRGQGAWVYDIDGLGYIDGNSSIWTNIHGHKHPYIDAAISAQLDRFAHVSFLGATHPGAIELATRLAALWSPGKASRVFYSDDGSTAIEAALKIALQYWQIRGRPEKHRFAAFQHAYHGDTAGASSLGAISAFHDRFSAIHFPTVRVSSMDNLRQLTALERNTLAAVVIEPLIQGVGGMRLWPQGLLVDLREWCTEHDILLIADEVLTAFGRTGSMFGCQKEEILPDLAAFAKGLTGGYLPLAATMVREEVFDAFVGPHDSGRTLFYGHSYTANALGCAAALASLDVFEIENTLGYLPEKAALLATGLAALAAHSPHVREIRQIGLIAGVELQPSRHVDRTGARVCLAARKHGLLTRPIGDTIVLMPPLNIGEQELLQAVQAIGLGIREVCGP